MKTLITFLLFSIVSFTQENPKLKVHSLGAGFGFFTSDYEISGICSLADLTIEYDKNLLSLNYLDGSELNLGIFGSKSAFHINELNLQYGRELKVRNRFSVEVYGGIGNYKLDLRSSSYGFVGSANAISFPIRIKLLFYTSKAKHFAISSNNNYSLNKINSNFSSNLTFQYNF